MGNKSSAPKAPANGGKKDLPSQSSPRPVPKNMTLLDGCSTLEQHHERIRDAILAARGAKGEEGASRGEEGLRRSGFEFRFVPCPVHSPAERCFERYETCVEIDGEDRAAVGGGAVTPPQSPPDDLTATTVSSPAGASRMIKSASVVSMISNRSDFDDQFAGHCHECATRLFHVGRQKKAHPIPKLDGANVEPKESEESVQPSVERLEKNRSPSSEFTSGNDIQQISAGQIPIDSHHPVVTMITPSNRQKFIADGAMYELIANLAQQTAQSKMCESFDLEWVTVCNESNRGEPVRALVDNDHRLLLQEGENQMALQELLGNDTAEKEEKKEDNDHAMQPTTASPLGNGTRSTLLIATGRGKVRAGIFSRHHLLTAGIEMGTSWHCIREARMRKWGVAIIDPNARGEEVGYESFRRSVSQLFDVDDGDEATSATSSPQPPRAFVTTAASKSTPSSSSPGGRSRHSIYVLAHSASGGQLVRHLREDPALLPSIRAVAFTDSTHNVQWCKQNPDLKDFLQRKNCVYLRSNGVRSSQSCVKVSSRGKDIRCDCVRCDRSAGSEADTDHFWEHRFGKIRTLWAGTADHALSNWTGHKSIWDHFDEHMEA